MRSTRKYWLFFPVIVLLLIFVITNSVYAAEIISSCASGESMEERWGVHVEGIRVSAAGYMLDFRYRILESNKAAALLDRKSKAYLVAKESGAIFTVPSPAKIGPLRQTSRGGKPLAGRTYFVLFANPGKYIKPGDKVTVSIGEFKTEDLVVR